MIQLQTETEKSEKNNTQQSDAALNRREFLTYAWGATMGLLAAEGGAASFLYLYPRFRAGEFGGKFNIGSAATLPTEDAAPQANTAGKFWLVNTQAGPKALYMVCTHLGCLYKWNQQNSHFECPCHGSTFSREGDYICGPAPRSLDQFEVEMVDNEVVAGSTLTAGASIVPPLVTESSMAVRVNTGKRIRGTTKSRSPAQDQEVCEEIVP